jgi:hypothetical protein
VTMCVHIYCRGCIIQHIQFCESQHRPVACPICRRKIVVRELMEVCLGDQTPSSVSPFHHFVLPFPCLAPLCTPGSALAYAIVSEWLVLLI